MSVCRPDLDFLIFDVLKYLDINMLGIFMWNFLRKNFQEVAARAQALVKKYCVLLFVGCSAQITNIVLYLKIHANWMNIFLHSIAKFDERYIRTHIRITINLFNIITNNFVCKILCFWLKRPIVRKHILLTHGNCCRLSDPSGWITSCQKKKNKKKK